MKRCVRIPEPPGSSESASKLPGVPIFTEIYVPGYLFSQKYVHLGVHIYNKYRHPLVKITPLHYCLGNEKSSIAIASGVTKLEQVTVVKSCVRLSRETCPAFGPSSSFLSCSCNHLMMSQSFQFLTHSNCLKLDIQCTLELLRNSHFLIVIYTFTPYNHMVLCMAW